MSEQLNIEITGKFNDQLTAATNKAKSSLESLKQTTDKFVLSAQKAGTVGKTAGAGIEQVGTSSQTAASKSKAFAQTLPGLLNGLSSVATSAVMLYRNYRDLNDTQTGITRATRALSVANEAEAKAQAKVNDLVAAGKQGTPEYAKALLDLEQAKMNVSVKTDMLREAEEKHQDAYVDFALSVIPGVLGALGTVAAAYNAHIALTAGTAAATNGLSTAMKALRVAMIAVPLVALATALLAIKTNAFGFRDSLDAIGVSIGNTFPQLKPLLQWIRDFATALGLAEKGMDFSKAWDLLVTGFQTAIKKLQEVDWKAVLDKILKGISDFIKNYDWATAWKSFTDAFASTVQWIKTTLAQIGKEVLNYIKANSATWWQSFKDAFFSSIEYIKTTLAQIGATILAYIKKNAQTWWQEFINALGASASFVGAQVAKIAQAILNYPWIEVGKGILAKIGEGLGAAGKGAQDFLGQLLSGGGKDKNFFTPINFPGQGVPPGTIVNEGNVPVGQQPQQPQGQGQYDTAQITAFQKALSTLSTSVATYTKSMIANITNFVTTFKTQFATLPPIILQVQTAFSTLSTAVAASATSMITTTGAWLTASTTSIGAFIPVLTLLQTTFNGLQIAIGAATTSMISTIAAWITASTTSIGAFIPVLTLLQTTFTTLQTATAANMTAMTTAVAAFITASSTSFGAFITVIKLVQQTFSTLSTSVATYMKSMTTNVQSFINTSKTGFATLEAAIKKTQTAMSSMSTSVNSSVKSMQSTIKSFASSAVSDLNRVASAAKSAASAFDKMAAAAKKAASAASKVGGMEHGGTFIAGAQHGFSGIVNRPTTFKGVRMGEGFKPEMVTVQPLTRGTGHQGGPTVSASGGGGGGSMTAVINVILDGRVIDRRIEKVALTNIGLQI